MKRHMKRHINSHYIIHYATSMLTTSHIYINILIFNIYITINNIHYATHTHDIIYICHIE